MERSPQLQWPPHRPLRYFTFLALLPLLGSMALYFSRADSLAPVSRDILTFHGDNARLGWYNDETLLRPDNINPDSFGKLWERDLGGQVYGQPLFVHNVQIRGQQRHVIYAATMTNRVHAIDATTGEWLWPGTANPTDIDPRNHGIYLGPPAPFNLDGCLDITGPIGVLSTMVIDRPSHTLYVVNLVNNRYRTLPPSGPDDEHFFLHALDLSTGQERPRWPVEIRALYFGAVFIPSLSTQRGALLLLNGRLYIPFSARCDIKPYRGWVFSYNAANPDEAPQIYCPSIGHSGSGLWGAGGLSADSEGNIYGVTGNAELPQGLQCPAREDPCYIPAADPPERDYSNSVVRLATRPVLRFDPQLANFYTPSSQTRLNCKDWDLGGSSVIVLPPQSNTATPNLLFTGGKDGLAYLINRDNLGGYTGPTRVCYPAEDTNPNDPALKRLRLWGGDVVGGIKTVPAYFAPRGGPNYLYLTGIIHEGLMRESGAKVVALQLTVDPVSRKSSFVPAWTSDPIATNTAAVVSSNGGDRGIVWVVDARKNSTGRSGDATDGFSVLNAYNALTGARLYNSDHGVRTSSGLERDRLGDGRKYSTLIVRDGRVFVGTTGIVAYGLLTAGAKDGPPTAPDSPEPVNLALRMDATAFSNLGDGQPTGSGNQDISSIRQGVWKFCTGNYGYTQFDTVNNTFQSSAYFGIRFPNPRDFNEMDFQLGGDNDGQLFPNGGWFATDSVGLEALVQSEPDQWISIENVIWQGYRPGGPNRPEAPRTAPRGAPLRAFDIFRARFATVYAYGLRIIGTPGQGTQSSVAFASCGQIRLFNRLPVGQGSIRTIAMGAAGSDTMYVGTYVNGLFKGKSGGDEWFYIGKGGPGPWTYALSVDPSDANTVYAYTRKGTSGGQFWKSTDEGSRWSSLGFLERIVNAVAVDPYDSNTVYAGAYPGIHKSTDGGMTWLASSLGPTNPLVGSIVIDPTDPFTIYLGTIGGGVFKTSDGGDSWSEINMGLTRRDVASLALDPMNSSVIYAGTYSGGIFKSINGGDSWSETSIGLTGRSAGSIAIDPTNSNVVYVGSYGSGVLKSTDGGGSWFEFNRGLTNGNVNALALDPTDPNRIYAGTNDGVYRRTFGVGDWAYIGP